MDFPRTSGSGMIDVALTRADLRAADVAVVVDVLRATTTATQALAAGYRSVLCAESVELALGLRGPGRVLAGERRCVAPPGFDQGNSPREAARRRGDELVLATTNGAPAIVAATAARSGRPGRVPAQPRRRDRRAGGRRRPGRVRGHRRRGRARGRLRRRAHLRGPERTADGRRARGGGRRARLSGRRWPRSRRARAPRRCASRTWPATSTTAPRCPRSRSSGVCGAPRRASRGWSTPTARPQPAGTVRVAS